MRKYDEKCDEKVPRIALLCHALIPGCNLTLRDDFVYEYIGEVVEQKEFMDRMQRYREEHIRHFYFMMLQREEVRKDVTGPPDAIYFDTC